MSSPARRSARSCLEPAGDRAHIRRGRRARRGGARAGGHPDRRDHHELDKNARRRRSRSPPASRSSSPACVALHRRPENRTGLYLAGGRVPLVLRGAPGCQRLDPLHDRGARRKLRVRPVCGARPLVSLGPARSGRAGDRLDSRSGSFVLWPLGAAVREDPAGLHRRLPRQRDLRHTRCRRSRTSSTCLDALVPVGLCAAARRHPRFASGGRRRRPPGRFSCPSTRAAAQRCCCSCSRTSSPGSPQRPIAVFSFLFVLFFAAVPFAFLFGILQSRLARGSVAGLMVSLEHGRPFRDAIADALGDPSLGVAFWVEDGGRWVDRDGRPLNLSLVPDQAITVVERDGRRIAALLHDESLSGEPELVESVSRGSGIRPRQRAAPDRAANAKRAVAHRDARRSEPAHHGRHRRPDPPPQSGHRRGERVHQRRGGRRTLLLGCLHRSRRAQGDDRALSCRRARAWPGRVREHLHERPWRDPLDHLARRPDPRRDRGGREHRRRRPRRDRAPPPGGGDPSVARPDRGGRRPGAPPSRAEPARRGPAAPRVALARPAARPGRSSTPIRQPCPRSSRAQATSSRWRSRSCASSPAASIRPCSPTAGSTRRSRGWPPAHRSRSSSSRVGRRLPEPIEAAAYYVVSEAVTNVVKHAGATCVQVVVRGGERPRRDRGRRRRGRRRRHGVRIGPARPRRPARRARRTAH